MYYKNRSQNLYEYIFLCCFNNMPFQPARVGLHFQIQTITATETSAREFLTARNVLCSESVCSRCDNAMTLAPCSEKKSADLYTWICLACTKFRSIRACSVLAGSYSARTEAFLLRAFAERAGVIVDVVRIKQVCFNGF